MELNKLKDGADWMTAEEKALCKEFVNGMRNKVFRDCGVAETPLLTMRMNATISTYLLARRLEAHLMADVTVEKQESQPEDQANEQTQNQPQDQVAARTEQHSVTQSDTASGRTPDPAPNAEPHSRSRTLSLLESIGKAWERNGRAIRDLEAHCEKAGTPPVTMGLADRMKPLILKTSGVIEESIRDEKERAAAGKALDPDQFDTESGQKVPERSLFSPEIEA